MPTRSGRVQAAIMRPSRAEQRIDVGRGEPPADLAGLVDYFWWVTWDTPEPHEQDVVPRPVMHVSAEVVDGEPRLLVHGVHPRMFRRRLTGPGHTVAAGFRPGGFRPFLRADVAALQGREVPAADVLGVDDRRVAVDVLACERPEDGAALLAEWLRGLSPEDDPMVASLAALVERVEEDTSLVRAEQLADLAGVSLRTLQRRFNAYVGIGPKWVVQALPAARRHRGRARRCRRGLGGPGHRARLRRPVPPDPGLHAAGGPPSRDLRAGGVSHQW